MGQMSSEHALRSLIDLKLDGARFQIQTLEHLGPTVEHRDAAIESCVDAAIDQMLQALDASLQHFNVLLPDSLPARRVSRRNLRDHFYAVQSDSRVVREIEIAARAREGWLWWLEEKQAAGAVASLVHPAVDGTAHLWRDPMTPADGYEPGSAADYLGDALHRISDLIERLLDQMPEDVVRYREAQRQQSRRLI